MPLRLRFVSLGAWLGCLAVVLPAAGVFSTVLLGNLVPAAAQAPDNAQPPADDPDLPKAQPARPPAASDSAAPTTPPKSQLRFFYEALGLRYTVAFLALSFTFVALIVMNILTLRRQQVVPLDLVESFESHVNEKRFQEAYEVAKADESFLGHVLSAGLTKLSAGYPQAIEAMQEVGEEEAMKLEQRLSYIALIGTVSPMVGLLGTVDGMVAAFQVIASRDTQPKPSELAQGVSMALITTLVGLWLAIPAIGIFGILRNRMNRLVLEVGVVGESLMSRAAEVVKKRPPA